MVDGTAAPPKSGAGVGVGGLTSCSSSNDDDDDDELAAHLAGSLAISSDGDGDGGIVASDAIRRFAELLAEMLGSGEGGRSASGPCASVSGGARRPARRGVVVVAGAGISCSAGIPDFRTPGTGLYDNLAEYGLPYPEAVFDVDFYRKNPAPFVKLASQLWPGCRNENGGGAGADNTQGDKKDGKQGDKKGNKQGGQKKGGRGTKGGTGTTSQKGGGYSPTPTHSFLTLLHQKGLLKRCYTQNIDMLEYLGGLPEERIVECHGHFRTAACCECSKPYNGDECRRIVTEECRAPKCEKCGGHVKPDIVFFGEGLPDRFHRLVKKDVRDAELVLVMGTSLAVGPVNMIPESVPKNCPRVLLNRECVGSFKRGRGGGGNGGGGARRSARRNADPVWNGRDDVVEEGDCDVGVRAVCRLLGWEEELNKANASTRVGYDGGGGDDGDYNNGGVNGRDGGG